MSTRHLVDPELLALTEPLPGTRLDADRLPKVRRMLAELRAATPVASQPSIRFALGSDGHDVPLHVYRAENAARPSPVLLHMHGGGMVLGSAADAATSLWPLVRELGIVGISVDYRLAPESRFPVPHEDCYAAARWVAAHADELGVDPGRIVLLGESAGAGLAAALAQMIRDRAEFDVAGQVLLYPMLDCRTGGPEDHWSVPMAGEFFWTREANRFAWDCLRGDYVPEDGRKGWFSPALADDLSRLPPTFLAVGDLDLFAAEDLAYAHRLMRAGVPVELHLYPGAPHAFDLIAQARVSQTMTRAMLAAIRRFTA